MRRHRKPPAILRCASYQCVLCDRPHQVCEPMGPIRPFPLSAAIAVANNGLGYEVPPAMRAAIIDRMVRFGEALWHAAARVGGMRCSCAACSNPNDPRHVWLIEDPA